MSDALFQKIFTSITGILGSAVIITVIDMWAIGFPKGSDSGTVTWVLLAIAGLCGGFIAGWVWRRWALILLVMVPALFIYLGKLHVRQFYTADGGWQLSVLFWLVPTIPALLLGIVVGGFLHRRRELAAIRPNQSPQAS